ncbi:macrophage migration inhibitory factor [Moniliophthora roreri MCA 2997]|uniref:L-dopachrome isomerase n=1 Tax=Moniliophthora roreri (strain MCA 2997) TaxID=1381753 RepID=V2WMV3_MONRO|nr:macrophage migration inhibitory factor [Moniliophthora roreri MCA 2997]
MSFSGTMDPAYQCTIISLGNLTSEANVEYSKVLSEHFEKTLGVSNERGYITFIDPKRTHLGYKGTTFAQIFKK